MQTTIAQQSADHEQLTKVIGKDIFAQGVEQQRFKRTLDDQHKFVSHIRTDVHSIIGRQRSLAQSMTVENRKTRDQILLQGKDSGRTMTQLQANVQHTDSQIAVLMALERSMAGGKTQYQRDLLHQLLQNATHSQTIVSNQDTLIQNQNEMLAELRDIATVARVSQAIPAQVLLSTPVILLDARGRSAPFHLEFIDSSEAFIAVLKVRFKDIGLRKIENGQFALEDTTRKRSLRLSDAWSTTVRPGQHISMSMIFRLQESPNTTCPSCGHENEESDETEVECANIACRLTYRRIVDISSSGNDQREEYREPSSQSPSSFCILGSTHKRKRVDSQEDSVDDDIKQYTRVQILTQELFEQEDGDLPMQYRRLTTRLTASLANHSAMRSTLDQAVSSPSPPEWPRGEATSNYWSFKDQRDFYNLALYYGRDWRAIAATMGTKTHIMVKNFYNRKIQEGDRGKQLEEEIARAEKLRAEGADMGPMPAPTPIRRRYISETRRRNASAFPSSHAETSSIAAQECPVQNPYTHLHLQYPGHHSTAPSPAFDMPRLSYTSPLLSPVAKEPSFAQGVYEDQAQWNPTQIFEQWRNAFGSSSHTTRQQI
ncbi:MAG: hypothetical protein Q9175_003762 [Cornicularia normoerica]